MPRSEPRAARTGGSLAGVAVGGTVPDGLSHEPARIEVDPFA